MTSPGLIVTNGLAVAIPIVVDVRWADPMFETHGTPLVAVTGRV